MYIIFIIESADHISKENLAGYSVDNANIYYKCYIDYNYFVLGILSNIVNMTTVIYKLLLCSKYKNNTKYKYGEIQPRKRIITCSQTNPTLNLHKLLLTISHNTTHTHTHTHHTTHTHKCTHIQFLSILCTKLGTYVK